MRPAQRPALPLRPPQRAPTVGSPPLRPCRPRAGSLAPGGVGPAGQERRPAALPRRSSQLSAERAHENVLARARSACSMRVFRGAPRRPAPPRAVGACRC